MIASRLSSVVLGVAASLAWTGCGPAVQQGVENQSGPSLVHEKAGSKFVPFKADEGLIRVRLLMADSVQKDLTLTADQVGKVVDFVKFSSERSRELAGKWPEFSSEVPVDMSEARSRELLAWVEDSQRRQKELMAQVLGMLAPSQRDRLGQIQLQQTMTTALVQPEFIKALDISEEQLAKIRPLSDRIGEKQSADLHELERLSSEERLKMIELTKKRDKARAEANKLALDVLTPEQRSMANTRADRPAGPRASLGGSRSPARCRDHSRKERLFVRSVTNNDRYQSLLRGPSLVRIGWHDGILHACRSDVASPGTADSTAP